MKRSALLVAALTLGAIRLASAAEPRPFNQKDFDKLAHDRAAVVVEVYAPWCPTCKAQKPIVDSLAKQSAYQDVVVLSVDFDTDKTILQQLRVSVQGTLIAFKGGKETARSVGATSPAAIEGIFKKAGR
ncbi:MAG: thioredoxin family protein [Gammaproteobacteria bacterium]